MWKKIRGWPPSRVIFFMSSLRESDAEELVELVEELLLNVDREVLHGEDEVLEDLNVGAGALSESES